MIRNLATIDKIIRILLAIAFVSLYFLNVISGTTGIILLIVAVIFAGTAMIGTCPIYLLLGISTKKKE